MERNHLGRLFAIPCVLLSAMHLLSGGIPDSLWAFPIEAAAGGAVVLLVMDLLPGKAVHRIRAWTCRG